MAASGQVAAGTGWATRPSVEKLFERSSSPALTKTCGKFTQNFWYAKRRASFFLLYFITSRSARMPEGYTMGILSAYTKRAATPLLYSGSPLIYQFAKRLTDVSDRSVHDAWQICQPGPLCVLCLSVAESQFVAVGLDVDRLCLVHGAG